MVEFRKFEDIQSFLYRDGILYFLDCCHEKVYLFASMKDFSVVLDCFWC